MLRLLALLAALLATPAFAVAPTVDATASMDNNFTSPTSALGPLTISPVTTGDVIVVFCFSSRTNASGSASSASTPTDTLGLTFTRRGTTQTFQITGTSGTPYVAIDTFWAFNSGSTADIITCPYGTAIDNGAIMIIAVTGANTTTPFDLNGSLPAVNPVTPDVPNQPLVTTGATTNANTLILLYSVTSDSASAPGGLSVSGSFTTAYNQIVNFGTNFTHSAIAVWPTTSTQSGTWAFASGATDWNGGWITIGDAVQAPGGGAVAAPTRTLLGVGQ